MKFDFAGQTVLVTGATRGIGRQIAQDFLESDTHLILTGKSKDSIKQLEKELPSNNVKCFAVDFSDVKSTNKFLGELKHFEKIDVCVNNVGINKIDYVEDCDPKDWDDIFAVNLKAPFLIIRYVAKIMKNNQYGRIVNIGSIFGHVSREKRSMYSATKFGLHGLTVAVSNELARHNVLVNTISPGFVLTDLTKNILSEKERQDLIEQIPAHRMAEPEDISKVVMFVASNLNSYLTGQNIIVDGGFVNV